MLLLAALAPRVAAQPTTPFFAEPESRGTSYFVFAEPGAPTFEVIVLGNGTRNGIYKLQEGTSLVQTLALAGGTARSDSTAQGVTTATVRVVRESGGDYQVIYQATAETLVRDRAGQPQLQTGDTIETRLDFVPAEEPGFTLLDGLSVASRVASLVSLVLLLVTRL